VVGKILLSRVFLSWYHTCENVTLCDKRDFADEMKADNEKLVSPWAQSHLAAPCYISFLEFPLRGVVVGFNTGTAVTLDHTRVLLPLLDTRGRNRSFGF
jgi:hypothetical protein